MYNYINILLSRKSKVYNQIHILIFKIIYNNNFTHKKIIYKIQSIQIQPFMYNLIFLSVTINLENDLTAITPQARIV